MNHYMHYIQICINYVAYSGYFQYFYINDLVLSS